jgi:hypothetical protein
LVVVDYSPGQYDLPCEPELSKVMYSVFQHWYFVLPRNIMQSPKAAKIDSFLSYLAYIVHMYRYRVELV